MSENSASGCVFLSNTLQRQNAENLKQIIPEKEYRGLRPNFQIHVSVSDPRWVCLFCWRKYVDWSWEYINRSKTHECGNWGWGRAIPRKGIYKRTVYSTYTITLHRTSFALFLRHCYENMWKCLNTYLFCQVIEASSLISALVNWGACFKAESNEFFTFWIVQNIMFTCWKLMTKH